MTDIEMVQCPVAGCGHSPYPLAEAFVRRARNTHETFHCPAGHPQSYRGKSDLERMREDRDCMREDRDWWRNRYEAMEAQVDAVARECPWIGCGFVAATGDRNDRRPLWSHMRGAHGMPTLTEVQETA